MVALCRVLLLVLLAPGVAAGAEAPTAPQGEERRLLDLASFDRVWTAIKDEHFDPTLRGLDWNAVRAELRPKVERAASADEARDVLRDLTGRLRQSHFSIIPADVLAAMGRPPGAGSPGGATGIDARVAGGRALVTSVQKGSAADSAGVGAGWEILAIDGELLLPKIETVAKEFAGRTNEEAILSDIALSRLEGRIGDPVRVRFRDGDGGEREIDLKRGEARGSRHDFGHVSNLHVWIESRRLPGSVGYVAFNAFLDPARVMPAFDAAMTSFLDADGIVIDLRGNGGGMLPIAMGMAGWLVSEDGTYLGTLMTRDTRLKAIVNPRVSTYAGPVAVLVDGVSASCAEAFAAGLQDLGRARLFGTRTMGVVLGSALEKLPNGDGFQYVFADFVSRSGRALEGVGVTPDELVPPSRDSLLKGKDPAVEAALAWIRGLKGAKTAPAGTSATPPAIKEAKNP